MLDRRAFTLIEVLIVVLILGILAAVVIPQLARASEDTKNAAAAETILTVQAQIHLYRVQHNDANAPITSFWNCFLSRTDSSGEIGTGQQFDRGPYLSTTPVNPYNGKSNVIAAGVLGSDGKPAAAILQTSDAGFAYDAETGLIWMTTGR